MATEIAMDAATGAVTQQPVAQRSLTEIRDALFAALSDRRWRAETAGIVVGGAPIRTDRESQSVLTSAYVQATGNPDFAVRWKVGPGQFVTLNAATIIAIGDTVTAHVQACFDHEDQLTTAILTAFAAGDREVLESFDIEAGWPGQQT